MAQGKRKKAKPWLHAHGPLGIRANPVEFPPLGWCMYCEGTEGLTLEHIIPFSMEGNYKLPASTCPACQSEINKFEQCARRMFGHLRTRLGFQTRNPEDRLTQIPLYALDAGPDDPPLEMGKAEDWAHLFLPVLPPPRVMTRGTFGVLDRFAINPINVFVQEPTPPPNGRRTDVTIRGEINLLDWVRLMAKIGHGLATARFNGRFRPLLRPTILGTAIDPCKYVGGTQAFVPMPPTPGSLHWTGWSLVHGSSGEEYLACTVRLFSSRGAPGYCVLVGDQLKGFTTNAALSDEILGWDEGDAPHYRFTADKMEIWQKARRSPA